VTREGTALGHSAAAERAITWEEGWGRSREGSVLLLLELLVKGLKIKTVLVV